jgi:hypothetical protein
MSAREMFTVFTCDLFQDAVSRSGSSQWYFENGEEGVHGFVINLRNHYTYQGLQIHIFLTCNLADIHMEHLFA